jgi:hypothetical protein
MTMNIRTLCFLVIFSWVISSAMHAQSAGSSATFHAGAYLHAKAGINTVVAQGWKTGPALAGMPDIGLTTRYVLSGDGSTSIGLDLGYNSATYESQSVETKLRVHEQYSYIAIFPHLNYQGFVLGVSYDLPVAGSCYEIDTDKETSMVSNRSVEFTRYLGSVPSVKTGMRVALMRNAGSTLNLDVMASYALGGLFANGRDYLAAYDYDGLTAVYNSAKNPTPAGLSIGLSYTLPTRF